MICTLLLSLALTGQCGPCGCRAQTQLQGLPFSVPPPVAPPVAPPMAPPVAGLLPPPVFQFERIPTAEAGPLLESIPDWGWHTIIYSGHVFPVWGYHLDARTVRWWPSDPGNARQLRRYVFLSE